MVLGNKGKAGKITIVRTRSNVEADKMTFYVKIDGYRVVQIQMRMEDFAYAITGQREVPCEIEVRLPKEV